MAGDVLDRASLPAEQRDELVHEVEMAATVQRQLLEQHRPPAGPLDIVARTEPARVVGGDYYDFVDMGDGRLAVVVADVSGKGLPAALVMPAVKIALRALVERHGAIPDVLAELNRVFLDNLPPASYLTLVFAVFARPRACSCTPTPAGGRRRLQVRPRAHRDRHGLPFGSATGRRRNGHRGSRPRRVAVDRNSPQTYS